MDLLFPQTYAQLCLCFMKQNDFILLKNLIQITQKQIIFSIQNLFKKSIV